MRISQWKQKLLFTFFYLALVAAAYRLGVGCLFRAFLHIPCPGCGMTRALAAVFRGDLLGAFAFHPMFWSLPVLYAYFLLDRGLLPWKWGNRILLGGIALGFGLNWLRLLAENGG